MERSAAAVIVSPSPVAVFWGHATIPEFASEPSRRFRAYSPQRGRDSRTNARVAQSEPPPGEGFRGVDRERQSLGLHRLCAVANQKIGLTIARSNESKIQPIRLDSDT
jgi:hypothetical protein